MKLFKERKIKALRNNYQTEFTIVFTLVITFFYLKDLLIAEEMIRVITFLMIDLNNSRS